MSHSLPPTAGVGFKPQHLSDLLSSGQPVGFIEVHAENYMGAGGPAHSHLRALRERYALSLHGVGLSIAGPEPLDREHLARLKTLCDRYAPESFSEHLAWSSHGDTFLNDLLPLPYTGKTLARVCEHIDTVQSYLGRTMLLENPSTYIAFAETTIEETDFLAEVARRTGCGLLLDINNVFVSATNHGTSAEAYLDAFPLHAVAEIHLGGHDRQSDEADAPLLIDSHGEAVADPVWALYERTIARTGARPTLIEWDNDVPEWPVLAAEARHATRILQRAGDSRRTRAA